MRPSRLPKRQICCRCRGARSRSQASNPRTPASSSSPSEIAKIIQDNPAQWAKHTAALHDVAVEIIKVIDERNVQGLLDTGEKLDTVCENCHLVHWYPKDKRPAEAPSLRK